MDLALNNLLLYSHNHDIDLRTSMNEGNTSL